jgi:hypothetical protein
VLDASARPAIAQTLEMELVVQEYLVAAARESMRAAQDQADAEPNGSDASASRTAPVAT